MSKLLFVATTKLWPVIIEILGQRFVLERDVFMGVANV